MTFNAMVVNKDDDGKTSAAVTQIGLDDLPAGDVTVAVEFSTVNYKDGLCLGPGGGLVRNYPHVPGIDFAGTVETSDDPRYKAGDKAAVTGRPETADYLKSLGATQIVAREDLNETTKRPLEAESWGGCVDAVGGEMLARLLGQMKYGASVSAVGLAGGAGLPATVIPFLLRGVNLLGIDSVMQPYDNRLRAWARIAQDLPMDKLDSMVHPATLADLPQLGRDILKGGVKGRVVVDVNA